MTPIRKELFTLPKDWFFFEVDGAWIWAIYGDDGKVRPRAAAYLMKKLEGKKYLCHAIEVSPEKDGSINLTQAQIDEVFEKEPELRD